MSIVATELKHKAEESECEKKEAFEDQAASEVSKASEDEANPEHIEITFCETNAPVGYSIKSFIKDHPQSEGTLKVLDEHFWLATTTKDKKSFIVYMLSVCARDGLVDIVRDIFLRDQELKKYLDSIKNKRIILKPPIWQSSTLLGTAAIYGEFNFVKFVIDKLGCDVHASGRNGYSPLEELFLECNIGSYSNECSKITKYRETAKYLLSHGAYDYRYLGEPIKLHPFNYADHDKLQELHFKKGEIISPHIIQSLTTLNPINQKDFQYREMLLQDIEDFIASRNQHIEQILANIYRGSCNPKFIKHILEYLTEPHLLLKQNKFAQSTTQVRNSLCSRINNLFSTSTKFLISLGGGLFYYLTRHPEWRETVDSNATLKSIVVTMSAAPSLIFLSNSAYVNYKKYEEKRTLDNRIKKRTHKLVIETDEGKVESDEEKIETEIASANAKSHKKRV